MVNSTGHLKGAQEQRGRKRKSKRAADCGEIVRIGYHQGRLGGVVEPCLLTIMEEKASETLRSDICWVADWDSPCHYPIYS